MDHRSFDALARSLGLPRSRRGLLGSLAAVGAGPLVGGGAASAQEACPILGLTRNAKGTCACPAGPDPCPGGCVDRKRDPGNCGTCGNACPPDASCVKGACRCPAGGCTTTTTTTTVPPCVAAQNGGGCAANSDCCSGICQSGTCLATVSGTCVSGVVTCGGSAHVSIPCGVYCACFEFPSGGTFCGVVTGSNCTQSQTCPQGYLPTAPGKGCCNGGLGRCVPVCPPREGTCFIGETLVAMADGTTRPVADVRVGDRVVGHTGVNRVGAVERLLLRDERLYALTGGPFLVTAEHPFLTEAGWKAVDPAATAAGNPDLSVGRLDVGDRLVALAGAAVLTGAGGPDGAVEPRFAGVELDNLIGIPADPATPVYNLRLDGDHTYIANGLVVHNE